MHPRGCEMWINISLSHPSKTSDHRLHDPITAQNLPILHHLRPKVLLGICKTIKVCACSIYRRAIVTDGCCKSFFQFNIFCPCSSFCALLSILWGQFWPEFKWIGSYTLSCPNFFTSYISSGRPLLDFTIIKPNFAPICPIQKLWLWDGVEAVENHPHQFSWC